MLETIHNQLSFAIVVLKFNTYIQNVHLEANCLNFTFQNTFADENSIFLNFFFLLPVGYRLPENEIVLLWFDTRMFDFCFLFDQNGPNMLQICAVYI